MNSKVKTQKSKLQLKYQKFFLILMMLAGMFFRPHSISAQSVEVVNDNMLSGINHFEYTGDWLYNFTGAPLEYNRDLHVSHTVGGLATFYFSGTQVRLYGVKFDYFGIGGISLDGGPETKADWYSPTEVDQALIYTSPVLPNGSHTLRIRVTGEQNDATGGIYILIDKAEVTVNSTICAKNQGDADCDGNFTVTDFEVWRKEFTGELTTTRADFNSDGNVDLVDFEIWRSNFLAS